MPVTPRIALQDFAQAVWFPLDEANGSTITDRVQGVTGTTANVTFAAGTRGSMPLVATSAATVPGDSISDIMRLDTLDGSLIVFAELNHVGGTPSGNSYLWSYGDPTDGVNGGLGALILTGLTTGMVFGQKGGLGSRTGAGNLTALINSTFTSWNSYAWVFDRFDGVVQGHGFYNGFHSRSCVYFGMDGVEVGAVPDATGLRIGARCSGSGSAEHIGAVLTNPRVRNFMAVRVNGDYRHRTCGWVRNMHMSMLTGEIPRLLQGRI